MRVFAVVLVMLLTASVSPLASPGGMFAIAFASVPQVVSEGRPVVPWGINEAELNRRLGNVLDPQVAAGVRTFIGRLGAWQTAFGFHFTRDGRLGAIILSFSCVRKCAQADFDRYAANLSKSYGTPLAMERMPEGILGIWRDDKTLVVLGLAEFFGAHYFSRGLGDQVLVPVIRDEAKHYFSIFGR